MRSRWLSTLFKWTATLGLIVGLFFLAYRVNSAMRAERAREGGDDKVQPPRRTQDGVVDLGIENADRLGIQEEPARSVAWSERIAVYGQVIPNSRATVEVHSPFAGTLRADPDDTWPTPGEWVRAGQVLGWVDIRIGTQERLNLRDNLNSARLKKQGEEKVVQLQRERVNRIEKVSRSLIVPGQQLDDARVLLAEAETQLAIASAAVELWRLALEEVDRPDGRKTSTFRQVLTAPADGEVTELAARPGMDIEAGALVAQLVDFRRPLVRLDLPPQDFTAGAPPQVELLANSANPAALSGVVGSSESSGPTSLVTATLAGPAPRVDPASQFVGFWYAVEPAPPALRSLTVPEPLEPGALWRPGLQVKAHVSPLSARPIPAVSVPGPAVLFHQGRPLVYVRIGSGRYERREVRLLGRQADRWVLDPRQGPSGISTGEVCVCRGAQVLLSEEFRSDSGAD